MQDKEIKTLATLLHNSETVHLGVEIITNLPEITGRVVDVLEQALIDWITLYRQSYSPLDQRKLTEEVITCLDSVVGKPFTNDALLAFPERCILHLKT